MIMAATHMALENSELDLDHTDRDMSWNLPGSGNGFL